MYASVFNFNLRTCTDLRPVSTQRNPSLTSKFCLPSIPPFSPKKKLSKISHTLPLWLFWDFPHFSRKNVNLVKTHTHIHTRIHPNINTQIIVCTALFFTRRRIVHPSKPCTRSVANIPHQQKKDGRFWSPITTRSGVRSNILSRKSQRIIPSKNLTRFECFPCNIPCSSFFWHSVNLLLRAQSTPSILSYSVFVGTESTQKWVNSLKSDIWSIYSILSRFDFYQN